MQNTTFIIMAGGEGRRLRPLTEHCPKPLARFGAHGRVIDFTLRNCLFSDAPEVTVLTQYLGDMVEDYLDAGWKTAFGRRDSELRVFDGAWCRKKRFLGTAHAVLEALAAAPRHVRRAVVLAADHVYHMDYRPLLAFHSAHGRAATVAAVECDPAEVSRFGIVRADASGRIHGFMEKPHVSAPPSVTGGKPLASMGIYVFEVDRIMPVLERAFLAGRHDFGRDVLPALAHDNEARAFRSTGAAGRPAYWRDIGDLASYWRAHLDMIADLSRDKEPELWKTVDDGSFVAQGWTRWLSGRVRMEIRNSMIAQGSDVGAAHVRNSVIGPRAIIEDEAAVVSSVVLDGAIIKSGARVINAVVGPRTTVAAGTSAPAATARDECPSAA